MPPPKTMRDRKVPGLRALCYPSLLPRCVTDSVSWDSLKSTSYICTSQHSIKKHLSKWEVVKKSTLVKTWTTNAIVAQWRVPPG